MTEEQIKKKEWLNRAYYADKKLIALFEERKKNRDLATIITTYYGGSEKGKCDSHSNGVETSMARLTEIDEKLELQIKNTVDVRCQISDAIGDIRNDELQAILIHRYLNFSTIEDIADVMNYSVSTVKRILSEAIDNVEPF